VRTFRGVTKHISSTPRRLPTAGASTRARRDREVERAARRARERDLVAIAALAALPLVTYVLARSGMSRLEAVGIAGFFAALAVAWRHGARTADEERVARWASGAWGEEATGDALARLDAKRFVVFHDVVLPGRRENIDHVVIGRGGVTVVETKRWAGPVVIGRHVRVAGARRDEVLDQVSRLRDALARALALDGDDVSGFVCVHARRVRRAWFRRRAEIDGVVFGGPDDLARWLRRRRRCLSRDEVRALAGALDGLGLESRAG